MTKVQQYLDSMNIQYDVAFTTHAGHEREIIEQTDLTPYNIIVACGGDGTLYSINNALVEFHKNVECIAQIPCGSGNGIANSLYHTADPIAVLAHIIKGKNCKVDGFMIQDLDSDRKYYGLLEFEMSWLSALDFDRCLVNGPS